MIYKILLNDTDYLYYPDSQYVLDNIELNTYIGEAETLTFDMYTTHPSRNAIAIRSSIISMYRDDTLIFYGDVREIERNLDDTITVHCLGMLSWLNDTVQAQGWYNNTTRQYFINQLISRHNTLIDDEDKEFTYGGGTFGRVTTAVDYVTTLEALRGGLEGLYLKATRTQNGVNYLYAYTLDEYGTASNQTINFGSNLLDYAEDITTDDLYTAVVPLGRQKISIERTSSDVYQLEAYYNVSEVNGGSIVVTDPDAVEAHGFICAVQQWDDEGIPMRLMRYAQNWLDTAQYETISLTLTAIDLSMLDSNFDAFRLGQKVRCIAEPLGVDITLPVTELTIYPLKPENNTLTLGAQTPTLTRYDANLGGLRGKTEPSGLTDYSSDHDFSSLVQSPVTQNYVDYYGTSNSQLTQTTVAVNYALLQTAQGVTVIPMGVGEFPSLTPVFDLYVNSMTGWSASVYVRKTEDTAGSYLLDLTGPGAYHYGNYGSLIPAANPEPFELYLHGIAPADSQVFIEFGSISYTRSTRAIPWQTYKGDADYTGSVTATTISGKRYAQMTGKIGLIAVIPCPDGNSVPSALYVKFKIKRGSIPQGVSDTDYALEIGYTSSTSLYGLQVQDLSTDEQTLTFDITSDGAPTSVYAGHCVEYVRIIEFTNLTAMPVYITDIHIYGDTNWLENNPYRELIAW